MINDLALSRGSEHKIIENEGGNKSMRKLLSRRWRGLPVGIITALLALVLISGGVLASYAVITGTVTVEVNEAFTVEYSLDGGTTWAPPTGGLPNGFTISVTGAYPGECMDIWVRITNASSSALQGEVSVVPKTQDAFALTYPTLPALFATGGVSVPGNGGSVTGRVNACVASNAPPATYTIDIKVLRGSQP